ncbi:MAG: zinc-dependent alcohol dehydrogenase family protein [Anaerolineae bacterium]
MKAVVFEKPGQVTIGEVKDPPVGADEVLLRVAACGVCGTDLHMYLGEFAANFPIIPGHEFSGVIAELGSEVNDLEVGQNVAVIPCYYCGQCDFCRENRPNFCQDIKVYGGGLNGAFAEYISVKRKTVYPCGDLSLEEVSVVEPVACCVHAFNLIGSFLGHRVLLFGCGSIGLILLQLSRINGAATVTAVDLFDKKLELAEKLGADVTLKADERLEATLKEAGPYDLVIDATGNPQVVQGMINYVRNAGTLLFFGVCPPEAKIEFSPFEIYRRELKIQGIFSLSGDFPAALRLVQSGAIDVRSLITHEFPLSDFMTALEMMRRPADSAKIRIKP